VLSERIGKKKRRLPEWTACEYLNAGQGRQTLNQFRKILWKARRAGGFWNKKES
jgi:hypothetical protein